MILSAASLTAEKAKQLGYRRLSDNEILLKLVISYTFLKISWSCERPAGHFWIPVSIAYRPTIKGKFSRICSSGLGTLILGSSESICFGKIRLLWWRRTKK